MRHRALLAVLLATATFPVSSAADDAPAASGATIPVNLEVHAELRHRLEIDAREKFNPDRSTTEQNLMRSRLGVRAVLPKKVTIYLQAQDARIWGEEADTRSGSAPRGDMHQGYVLATDFVAPGVSLKLGRMELSYGNERLVGVSNWGNTGRAFDGVVLSYAAPTFQIDVFETKIGEGVGNASRGRDYDFFGAYGTTTALAGHTIDAFALFNRDADTLGTGEERLKRLTIGARAKGAQGGLGYEVEGGSQTGDAGATSISAAYFGGRVSYSVAHAYKPTVGFGVDWLSGDDDTTDDETKVFDTLFGTGHRFYGYMDYFTEIPTHTRGLGLLDIMFMGSMSPAPWLQTRLHIHSFQSAEDMMVTRTSGAETLSSFGTEVDLIASIECTENVAVEAGAAVFAPGDIFEETRGEDNAYWSYLQTTVSF